MFESAELTPALALTPASQSLVVIFSSEQLQNILLTNSPGNLILAQLCRQWKSINMTWSRSSEETARYFIPQCGEIFLAKNF